jgi:hypothetical protein
MKTDVRENRMGWYAVDSSGSGQEPVEGVYEHGNEPSGSITFWEILEYLSDWWLPNKDSTPWSWLVGWLVGRLVG